MGEDVRLPDLLAAVRSRAAGGDQLAQLDAAITLSRDVEALAEELLDHVVRESRSAGLTWTVIGQRLGVSKQAARVRFAGIADVLAADGADPELAPRLVACLDRAAEEARADGSAEVGTHHLLIGLMEAGVAAAVLERLGVRVDALRATATALFGAPGPRGDRVPPMSQEARCALQEAPRIFRRHGTDGFVGTEHVLFVLATDPGSRARRVLNELTVDVADLKRELGLHVSLRARRRRRRRDRQQV
ncbi:MAG: Clp protease N-terminal domain-containing protein [Pseudonocardiaceae bacterium]